MTPMGSLRTCSAVSRPGDEKRKVEALPQSRPGKPYYHHLPVTKGQPERIVGFFSVKCACPSGTKTVRDAQGFRPISTEDLVGAGTTILEFIQRTGDTPRPYLVVGGRGVGGLVNSADLVDPLVGMALSARILEFETRLNEWITERYGESSEWEGKLGSGLGRMEELYQNATNSDIEPSSKWMYGTLGQKLQILDVDRERQQRINDLRNAVLHTRPPSEIRAALQILDCTEQDLDPAG